MPYEDINQLSVVIFSSIIVICSIIIIICIRFENKQKKKYNECLRLIKEKENNTLNDNIMYTNDNLENKLMDTLYNIYLEFINKLNKNQKDFDNLLDGFAKEFYENKVDIYSIKNCFEITDYIDLQGYSLIEHTDESLKFRVKITCVSYKKINEEIVSGDNLNKIEQINIITYEKNNNDWLITNIEKVYEKKLS